MLHRKAFTLIELMIVMIIVAILAAAAVPIYSSMVSRAYETEVLSCLGTVRTALRVYKAEHGDYPPDSGALGALLTGDHPYLTEEDFDDLQYVEYADLQIDAAGVSKWVGSIDGYSFGTVTLSASGSVSRS